MDIHYFSCCSNRFSMRFNVQTFKYLRKDIQNDSFFEMLLDLIFVHKTEPQIFNLSTYICIHLLAMWFCVLFNIIQQRN